MRQQYLLVCLDQERAITALPKLLGADAKERKANMGCPASGPFGTW